MDRSKIEAIRHLVWHCLSPHTAEFAGLTLGQLQASLGAKAVRGDVFDADGVRRAVALAAPDVVMHQLTDLKGGNRQANSEMRVTGTRNLMDAALAAGVRRVVAQSIAWAYAAGEVPAAEDGSGCAR